MTYFNKFLIDNIILVVVITFILFVKRILKKQITERYQYNFYFLVLILLLIPILPINTADFNIINKSKDIILNNNLTNSNVNTEYYNTDWLNNFSISVNTFLNEGLTEFLFYSWIIGIIIFLLSTLICIYKIKSILKLSYKIKDRKILNILYDCKRISKINQRIYLLESSKIKMPFSFGFIKTFIVLPKDFMKYLSHDDIKYIFLHELAHYKNKDMLINYILSFFQIIYWFNPIIWFVFKQMKNEREIICDLCVLNIIEKENYINYGKTIIHFIDNISRKKFLNLTSNIGGTKKQIKKRIESIASFSFESKKRNIKSIFIFIFTCVLILVNSSFIFAENKFYFNEKFELKDENIEYTDLSSYFNNIDGCFVLYDLKNDKYDIYNKENSISRLSPNSTYKIYSALFALESNVIQPENTELNWNGVNYPFEQWNANHDLKSAMQNSVNWYFKELDQKTGLSNLKNYFKRINYGNYNLSSGIDNYWLELNSLKISPVEQVKSLKALYLNKYMFNEDNIKAVKNSLLIERKNEISIYGKTGSALINNKWVNGWFVGFIETNDNVYFFSSNVKGTDNMNGSAASNIAFSILYDKNIIE